MAFDSAALAAALAVEPAPEAAAPQTSADTEATGTDIPSQDEAPAPREGFLARLKGWWHTGRWAPLPSAEPAATPVATPAAPETPPAPAVEVPEVEPEVRAEPAPEPDPEPDLELEGLLVAILDDLGSAHHRPFSRA